MSRTYRRLPIRCRTGLLVLVAAHVPALATGAAAQHEGHAHPVPSARPAPQSSEVRAEFSLSPGQKRGPDGSALEKQEIELQVRLTDPATGRPVVGLRPMAWVDVRSDSGSTSVEACRQKLGAFAEGSLHVKHGQVNIAQPVEDLNGHYVLAMAKTPQIAVIDPITGFGRTKLYTTVPLEKPGGDWAANAEDTRLYVTMPEAGKVAVVNTHTWKLAGTAAAGATPTRIVFQPGERYLWVSNEGGEGGGGVTVLDPQTLRVAASIPTGPGPHSLAFSDDGRLVFVASREAGTVSVIDVARLERVKELRTGPRPISIDYSAAQGAAYVAHAVDGTVVGIDAKTLEITDRVQLKPGIFTLRFAPDPAAGHGHGGHGEHGAAAAPGGRLAFVLNPRETEVDVLDVVSGRRVRNVQLGREPDQVAFTSSFAYIRSAGDPNVHLIPLHDPTTGGTGPHDFFPAGSSIPGPVLLGLGEVMVPSPGMHDAVYVANPKDRMIYSYHYMEGMPIPHGGLTTYGFEPKAIRTISRRVRETEEGLYSVSLRLERSGVYDLIFRSADPVVLECFPFSVARDPSLAAASEGVRVETVPARPELRKGENVLRFRVRDGIRDREFAGLTDVRVQFASMGGWQQRVEAHPVEDGMYEVRVSLPQEGIYYVGFEIPSLKLGLRDRASLVLRAGGE
ncbi:MAG TPA: cytochrome D1 domain-containing protein [Longimicrobiaceae bacterium]|nr:cytochrome D1 domain-containing protein [Longimicrobiaceae bacterium]